VDLDRHGLSRCFQCGKCSAGCPLAGQTDIPPHALIRLLLLGQHERVLAARAPWLCIGCNTCVTRCPNEVDLPAIMDELRAEATDRGIAPAEKNVEKFHEAFLKSLRRHGRLFELGLMMRYQRRSGTIGSDMGMGWQMLRKGKLHLWPRRPRGRKDVKRIFKREQP